MNPTDSKMAITNEVSGASSNTSPEQTGADADQTREAHHRDSHYRGRPRHHRSRSEIHGAQSPDNESAPIQDEDEFIQSLNQMILCQCNDTYFPIEIRIPHLTEAAAEIMKKYNLQPKNEICLTNKSISDKLIAELVPLNLKLHFNYSKFISHPGNIFVKNFSKSRISHAKLFKYFNSQSLYKSLKELNLFNMNTNNDDEVFAILKFDNYLDVDFLLNRKFGSNPFNTVPSHQLYLNKYISKKERKLINDENDEFNNYNTLIFNNLIDFFPTRSVTLETMNRFLDKIKLFGPIQSVYFPVTVNNNDTNDDNDNDTNDEDRNQKPKEQVFSLLDFGFINFDTTDSSNLSVLKCIYLLNSTTFEEFMECSEESLTKPITLEDDQATRGSRQGEIKISIAQHKHNHHLYQFYPNILGYDKKGLTLSYVDFNYHSVLINSFVKYFNYQETNVYVNNFPTVFRNNDQLWERFWKQFGSIKSAKIIKPQFYSKEDQSVGKIGFVFFNDFQMAVKAVILANNKFVNAGSNSNYLIKASFAIQRLNKDKRKKSGEGHDILLEQSPINPHQSALPYRLPPQASGTSPRQGSPTYYYDQPYEPNSRSGSSNEDEESYSSYTYGPGTAAMMPVSYPPPQFAPNPYYFPVMVPGHVPYMPYYNYIPNYSVNSPQ